MSTNSMVEQCGVETPAFPMHFELVLVIFLGAVWITEKLFLRCVLGCTRALHFWLTCCALLRSTGC